MRYAVISDIHANMHALESVLTKLDQLSIDRHICAGDLVGYGAHPNECVELIASVATTCVAGNHDLIAVDRISAGRCGRLAWESLQWTKEVLDDVARSYLRDLPLSAETSDGVIVSHGSLDDPQEYITETVQAAKQLDQLTNEHPDAHVLLLGHTHQARLWGAEGRISSTPTGRPLRLAESSRWLINPGSVGQSRERRVCARFVILDTERHEATFHAVPYDVEGCRQALRQHGLSAASYHRPPKRRAVWLSRARRLAGRRGHGGG